MESSTAIEAPTGLPAALMREPIIDQLHEDQVKLITQRAQAGSKGQITRGEIAAFLELAATYGLDPFASEVWLAKGKNDKVLIMVGRDGLRKIAQRNGLYVDGDVIHEEDSFSVTRSSDGTRSVEHSYGHPSQRGPIIGAWCEVRQAPRSRPNPLSGWPGVPPLVTPGRVAGFFVATVDEYKPTSEAALQYSPWGAQASVMILAAAERQALRQATPLSGLVAQGELDRAEEAEAVVPLDEDGPLHEDPALAERIEAMLAQARQVGHAGLANRGAAAMALRGQSAETVEGWLSVAGSILQATADAGPEDATVVDGDDGEPVPPPAGVTPDTFRKMAAECRADAEGAKTEEDAASLHGEADELEARADALEADPEQPELGEEG